MIPCIICEDWATKSLCSCLAEKGISSWGSWRAFCWVRAAYSDVITEFEPEAAPKLRLLERGWPNLFCPKKRGFWVSVSLVNLPLTDALPEGQKGPVELPSWFFVAFKVSLRAPSRDALESCTGKAGLGFCSSSCLLGTWKTKLEIFLVQKCISFKYQPESCLAKQISKLRVQLHFG